MTNPHFNYRRNLIVCGAAALTSFTSPSLGLRRAPSIKPKRVAAIASTYYKGSHADVILGKILEGWEQTGGPGPALELAALYVEQIREDDESVRICRKHSIPMFRTIRDTITCGTDHIPVDGVLCIAEPHMTGLGGDCFVMLSVDGSTNIKALNGSGRSSENTSSKKLRSEGHFLRLSLAIPSLSLLVCNSRLSFDPVNDRALFRI